MPYRALRLYPFPLALGGKRLQDRLRFIGPAGWHEEVIVTQSGDHVAGNSRVGQHR